MDPNQLASVVHGLTPMSRWFATISAMAALVFWTFSDHLWMSWPWPARWAVTLWVAAALIAPVVILATNVASSAMAAYRARQLAVGADADDIDLVPEVDDASDAA